LRNADDLDGLVQWTCQAKLDALAFDHRAALEDSLSDHRRDVWICLRLGVPREGSPSLALVFAINLVSNLLFMLIFAGMRNVSLAAMDVVLMWATIIWCIVAVWRHYRWIAVAQIPYLTWASIDMVMHLSIEVMNW
jgi:uncharacterized membrane protein